MHQVELIDQAVPFQEFNGPVDCGAVNARVDQAGLFKPRRRIKVLPCALHNFH